MNEQYSQQVGWSSQNIIFSKDYDTHFLEKIMFSNWVWDEIEAKQLLPVEKVDLVFLVYSHFR